VNNALQIQSVGSFPTLSGEKIVNVTVVATNQIASIVDSNLLMGDNVVVVPLNATNVTIVPPTANTAIVTIKGNAADIGVKLHKTQPSSLSIDPATTSFILNVSANSSGWEFTFI